MARLKSWQIMHTKSIWHTVVGGVENRITRYCSVYDSSKVLPLVQCAITVCHMNEHLRPGSRTVPGAIHSSTILLTAGHIRVLEY
jgi:hypothetical protein